MVSGRNGELFFFFFSLSLLFNSSVNSGYNHRYTSQQPREAPALCQGDWRLVGNPGPLGQVKSLLHDSSFSGQTLLEAAASGQK